MNISDMSLEFEDFNQGGTDGGKGPEVTTFGRNVLLVGIILSSIVAFLQGLFCIKFFLATKHIQEVSRLPHIMNLMAFSAGLAKIGYTY